MGFRTGSSDGAESEDLEIQEHSLHEGKWVSDRTTIESVSIAREICPLLEEDSASEVSITKEEELSPKSVGVISERSDPSRFHSRGLSKRKFESLGLHHLSDAVLDELAEIDQQTSQAISALIDIDDAEERNRRQLEIRIWGATRKDEILPPEFVGKRVFEKQLDFYRDS